MCIKIFRGELPKRLCVSTRRCTGAQGETNDYFMAEGMNVLPSPERSHDINVIENCWGLLVGAL